MSDDNLSPTGMEKSENEISKDFNNDKDEKIKGKNVEVPDMIMEMQPHPAMRPPWDVSDIERDCFDDKWNQQIEKYKQVAADQNKGKDPFDKIDQEHESQDRLDKDRGPDRD